MIMQLRDRFDSFSRIGGAAVTQFQEDGQEIFGYDEQEETKKVEGLSFYDIVLYCSSNGFDSDSAGEGR